MNVSAYYTSISMELDALKNRVRNFIAGSHWLTDGEWKESVLRTVLRRHLPDNIKVGRGFIVTPGECSEQIDVLIYDASKPILYRDGDLVFVTSDAVRGIVEVKSTVRGRDLGKVLSKLAKKADLAYRHYGLSARQCSMYVGLFAYDTDVQTNHSERVLRELKRVARGSAQRVVNHLSLGDSFFVKYWERSPSGEDDYNKWHSYYLGYKAPAYFINNVVQMVAEESVDLNQDVWFPLDGKENYIIDDMPLSGRCNSRRLLVSNPPYAR